MILINKKMKIKDIIRGYRKKRKKIIENIENNLSIKIVIRRNHIIIIKINIKCLMIKHLIIVDLKHFSTIIMIEKVNVNILD